jgi:hypothetical protein
MKPRALIFQCLPAMLLSLAAFGPPPLSAAPAPQPAKQEIPPAVSVFAYPNNPVDGRDPFFPASIRVYGSNPDKPIQGPSVGDLTLKSIMGAAPRYFVIIGTKDYPGGAHTFGAGEDGDVINKAGQRQHIRVVDINPRAGTATVEENGLSGVLHLSGGP